MKTLVAVVALLSVVLSASAQPSRTLDSLFASLYPSGKPGAAIAVVKGGAVVFKHGYGTADLESRQPITPTTNFNICSMTKQFTAFGILQLQHRGKLSLADKIIKYFPDFTPAVGSVVTIRHLLSHSSGIVEHYSYVDRALYKEFWDRDVLTAVKGVDTMLFPAGTRYRYSNAAFCLLALIIERCSGKSYPEYVRDEIFKPLGMDRSGVIKPDFSISERAFGYECNGDTITIADAKQSLFFSTQGDGGIYTSIEEYLKWIQAIQQGNSLTDALIREAQSPQNPIDTARHLSYGYGWFVGGGGQERVVYHTGSNGGFRTIIFTKPAEQYAVVIFSNRTGVDLEDLIRTINKSFGVDDRAFVKLEDLIF